MTHHQTTRLVDLEPHSFGEIVDIDAPDQEKERLMSMGVCPGRTAELVMKGDPMIIRVLGTRIGLSARLGDLIVVEECHEHCDEDEPDTIHFQPSTRGDGKH